MIGSFILSSGSMGVTLLRASATGMSTPFLLTTLKGRYGKDLTMSLCTIGLRTRQEVMELFHSLNGSQCFSLQILIILSSLCQGSGNITNHFPLLYNKCTKSLLGSIHLEGCFCIDIKVWKSPHVGNFHL